MRISILSLLLFAISLSVSAQNEGDSKFRPIKNNFSLEVDFIPFNPESPIGLNTFRGRLFLSGKIALRLGFNIRGSKNYSEYPANLHNDDVIMFNTINEEFMVFGLNTGLEYHLLKSERISPYIGLDFGFENKSSDATYENVIENFNYPAEDYTYSISTTEIENAWEGTTYIFDPNSGYYIVYKELNERAYTKFTINAVAGVDIYIVKHLYLGFEIGLGYSSVNAKKVEVKIDEKIEKTYPKTTDTKTGLNVNKAIRLGIWF
jgi:hypothetical protein